MTEPAAPQYVEENPQKTPAESFPIAKAGNDFLNDQEQNARALDMMAVCDKDRDIADTKSKPHVLISRMKLMCCYVCSKSFSDPHSLNKHCLSSHLETTLGDEKKMQCWKCSLPFKYIDSLLHHGRLCWQSFKLNADGSLLQTQTRSKYLCKVCSRTLANSKSFKNHMATHDKLNDKAYHCPSCSRTFKRQVDLRIHTYRFHASVKPYACHVCPKTYAIYFELKEHLLVHTGLKEFQCHLCAQRFLTKRRVMKHIRFTHSDKKPHTCDVCSAAFKTRGKLKTHQFVHSAVKPNQCPFCPDRQFAQKSNLKVHMMSHSNTVNNDDLIQSSASGKGPYKCSLCPDRVFNQKGNLRIHISLMHSGK